jgi:hypothetical protein
MPSVFIAEQIGHIGSARNELLDVSQQMTLMQGMNSSLWCFAADIENEEGAAVSSAVCSEHGVFLREKSTVAVSMDVNKVTEVTEVTEVGETVENNTGEEQADSSGGGDGEPAGTEHDGLGIDSSWDDDDEPDIDGAKADSIEKNDQPSLDNEGGDTKIDMVEATNAVIFLKEDMSMRRLEVNSEMDISGFASMPEPVDEIEDRQQPVVVGAFNFNYYLSAVLLITAFGVFLVFGTSLPHRLKRQQPEHSIRASRVFSASGSAAGSCPRDSVSANDRHSPSRHLQPPLTFQAVDGSAASESFRRDLVSANSPALGLVLPPARIYNVNNTTCYLASSNQCMMAIPEFYAFFLTLRPSEVCSEFVRRLSNLMTIANRDGVVNLGDTTKLLEVLPASLKPDSHGSTQQDSAETFRATMAEIGDAENLPTRLCKGMFQRSHICPACGCRRESDLDEDESVLMVRPIPEMQCGTTNDFLGLNSNQLNSREPCQACNHEYTQERVNMLAAPIYLVMEIANYANQYCWIAHIVQWMLKFPLDGGLPFIYKLIAFTVHIKGEYGSNHYISYVRRPCPEGGWVWFRCDDSRITMMTPEEMFEVLNVPRYRHTPNLLIYERVDA